MIFLFVKLLCNQILGNTFQKRVFHSVFAFGGHSLRSIGRLAMSASVSNFYEVQLAVLATFCIFAVFLERRSASKKNESQASRANGHARTLSQATNAAENGANGSVGWKRASSASALSRQYLIVYGIVMCEHLAT